MLDMTLIRELRAEARAENGDIEPLLQAITDLLHEVEKTPWRIRELVGHGCMVPARTKRTHWHWLSFLVATVGRLSTSVADGDRLSTELGLADIASLCINWTKEMEHARLGAD